MDADIECKHKLFTVYAMAFDCVYLQEHLDFDISVSCFFLNTHGCNHFFVGQLEVCCKINGYC